jgi:hypothetical protein
VKLLVDAVASAFVKLSVEEYQDSAAEFVAGGQHPTLGRPYRKCAYAPMVEPLRYLEGAGFTTLIASGGDRDFMRPIASELYGIPPERVIGSSLTLDYGSDGLVVKKGLDVVIAPEWARGYRRDWLRPDLIAALACSLCAATDRPSTPTPTPSSSGS